VNWSAKPHGHRLQRITVLSAADIFEHRRCNWTPRDHYRLLPEANRTVLCGRCSSACPLARCAGCLTDSVCRCCRRRWPRATTFPPFRVGAAVIPALGGLPGVRRTSSPLVLDEFGGTHAAPPLLEVIARRRRPVNLAGCSSRCARAFCMAARAWPARCAAKRVRPHVAQRTSPQRLQSGSQ